MIGPVPSHKYLHKSPARLYTIRNEKRINMVSEGLHKWFSHKNGSGGGGWVDCNKSKKGKLVPCGRKEGSKRSYPACRPTLSACNSRKRLKKSSARISWEKKK